MGLGHPGQPPTWDLGPLSLSKDRWPRVSLWQGLKILTDQEPADGIWSVGEAQAWQTPVGRPGLRGPRKPRAESRPLATQCRGTGVRA